VFSTPVSMKPPEPLSDCFEQEMSIKKRNPVKMDCFSILRLIINPLIKVIKNLPIRILTGF
jgi:hypothetical protein